MPSSSSSLPDYIVLHSQGQAINISPRRSLRAKRLGIRITPPQNVELILPQGFSFQKAQQFLHQQEHWIRRKLRHMPVMPPLTEGTTLPILGKDYTIEYSGRLRGSTHIDGHRLVISGDPGILHSKIIAFLRTTARQFSYRLATQYAQKIHKNFRAIHIRDAKTRWGSCSSKHELSFSWRLALAPYDVFDYVVAHETAHLVHMNHSQDFWQVVQYLCPHYKQYRQWLKYYGHTLHGYFA